jgi:CHAP domain
MSPSWWQEPYRGGGPAKVKGFPRPLYPNAAKNQGKNPSIDGPDVLAYKRTISRCGRWPWQEFDDHFSDRFSLGNPSSSVPDSGVAGFQRQQHIDDTGWIGEKTFNSLRYALVPAEFQHGGEQAMDGKAISLLNEAWEMFKGSEPPPPSSGTLRQKALKRAQGQLGYKESPPGSNNNKYGVWYGMNYQPWCAMFCTWCFENEGNSPAFAKASRYSYVPYIVADAQDREHGLSITQDPIPGDLVCYDWSYDTIFDHIGIFENWTSLTTFEAIEGNTSTSNNSNGGEVMRRSRSIQSQKTVFVRVAEP